MTVTAGDDQFGSWGSPAPVVSGPVPAPQIAIFTIAHDFHAYAIRHELANRGVGCAIVEVDALADRGHMSWTPSGGSPSATVRDVDDNDVAVRDLKVIWWRRLLAKPRLPDTVQNEAVRDLIGNDCRATLIGLALTEFGGTWLSHPEATRAAENKLVQLRAAQRVGLPLPRTLVSQNPEAIRRFCAELGYQAVVKPVSGTRQTPIMTGRVAPDMLTDDAIRLSPAIYQEYIPGTRHLRVCLFGDTAHTASLETEALDWRYPLDAKAEPYDLDEGTVRLLRRLLAELDLGMGIFDMKLLPSGEPIWLEINPQGQFLFLEGLCRMPLTDRFTDFLVRQLHPCESIAGTPPMASREDIGVVEA